LSWLGMISAMLSISLTNTKFCSSFLNICKQKNMKWNTKMYILTNVLVILTTGWRHPRRTSKDSQRPRLGSLASSSDASRRIWWPGGRRRRCLEREFGNAAKGKSDNIVTTR
jgi:hypothetical protein